MQRFFSQYGSYAFVYLCYFIVTGGWIAFWPLWLKNEGFNSQTIGLITSAILATKIFAPAGWGYFADKQSRHLFYLRLSGIAALISFSAIFLRQDLYWLLLVVFGFSFFWNAMMPQLEVLTFDALIKNNEPARYTQVRVWGSIGFMLSVIGLGYLFDLIAIAWLPHVLFASLGILFLASLLLPNAKVSKPEAHTKGLSIFSTIKQPAVFSFFLVCFFLQLAFGSYYTFFSVYLEDLGYGRKTIGYLWTAGVLAEVILYIFMAKVFARFSLRAVLCFSLAVTVVRWLLIGYLAQHFYILLFAQMTHALSFGAYHAVGVALIRRFFAGGNEGVGMGLYSGISFGLGGTLGAYISGQIWDYSPQVTFTFAAAMTLIAFLIAFFGVKGNTVSAPEV